MKYWVIWRTKRGDLAEVLCPDYDAAQKLYRWLCKHRSDVSMQPAQTVSVSFTIEQ